MKSLIKKILLIDKMRKHFLDLHNNINDYYRWIFLGNNELHKILEYNGKVNKYEKILELKKMKPKIKINKKYTIKSKSKNIIEIKFEYFSIYISTELFDKMRKINNTEKYLVKLFLSYEIVEDTRHSLETHRNFQGSLPTELFNYLNNIGIEYELFASPFFPHLKYFCSAFKIDMKFGSLGNFFNLTNKDIPDVFNAQAAPPNGEIFLEKFINKLLELIDNKKYFLILFLPAWDLDIYNKINGLGKKYVIDKNIQIYQTNSVLHSSKYIKIPTKAYIFILTNYKDNIDDIYKNIIKIYNGISMAQEIIKL